MYILKSLRLKDPDLVDRWEKLKRFAEQVPQRPDVAQFDNFVNSEFTVSGLRPSGAAAPEMVFFIKRSGAEALRAFESGGALVTAQYKISTSVPFLVKDVEVTQLSGGPTDQRPGFWDRLRADIRRLRMAERTNLLTPTAGELDELLEFLDGAELRVQRGRLKS